jgi:hypothetical protein
MSCFALTGRRRQRNPKKGVIPVPEPMRISGVERVGRQAEISEHNITAELVLRLTLKELTPFLKREE